MPILRLGVPVHPIAEFRLPRVELELPVTRVMKLMASSLPIRIKTKGDHDEQTTRSCPEQTR